MTWWWTLLVGNSNHWFVLMWLQNRDNTTAICTYDDIQAAFGPTLDVDGITVCVLRKSFTFIYRLILSTSLKLMPSHLWLQWTCISWWNWFIIFLCSNQFWQYLNHCSYSGAHNLHLKINIFLFIITFQI